MNNKNTLNELSSTAFDLYITKFSAWAPGVETSGEWDEWALGKREINITSDSPDIAFTEAKFRRRLSQISKMTIHVVHDLLPASDTAQLSNLRLAQHAKIFFFSFRGELSRQFDINKMLIEDSEIMPAPFSLSVFNAPAALAAIAFGLKGGYSAIYPGNNSFASGLMLAEAAFHDEKTLELIFIYADENVPSEYSELIQSKHPPLAFAFLLTRNPGDLSIPLSSLKTKMESSAGTPEDFLKHLILTGRNS